MSVFSGERAEFSRRHFERESSPERIAKAWIESKKMKKASVVYYLSRNGQLEHPHFMEFALSSRDGLCLKDVINRLNALRGNGMASLFSWSCKRSYKNGFVWQDLSEEDLIYPAQGNEYVLKGSELLHLSTSSSSSMPQDTAWSEKPGLPSAGRKKMTWDESADDAECRVFKNELSAVGSLSARVTDASTQTSDEWRRNFPVDENPRAELSCDDISPSQSSSSTERLEALIKTSASVEEGNEIDRSSGSYPSGRFRASASAVLMHLISCGSIAVKDRSGGYSLPTRSRLEGGRHEEIKEFNDLIDIPNISAIRRLEDKEYFSGSIIETKKKTHAGDGAASSAAMVLKRSSSYNTEKSLRMEMECVQRARGIPVGKATERAASKKSAEGSK